MKKEFEEEILIIMTNESNYIYTYTTTCLWAIPTQHTTLWRT